MDNILPSFKTLSTASDSKMSQSRMWYPAEATVTSVESSNVSEKSNEYSITRYERDVPPPNARYAKDIDDTEISPLSVNARFSP